MKKIGYIIFTIGFIAGSLTTVTDVLEVNWVNFLITIAITVVGIYMVRSHEKAEISHEETVSENMSTIKTSLEQIVKGVKDVRENIDPEYPQMVHHKIDESLPEQIELFVDSRKTIGHVHGLQNYAEVMNHFAAAERYLNRVWSASTDGYIDEINEYIVKSEEEFERALGVVNSLK